MEPPSTSGVSRSPESEDLNQRILALEQELKQCRENQRAVHVSEKRVHLVVKSLHEELLLREIHHRVKNNLQVITGLISLQAEQVNDRKLESALDELQSRVRAIANVHEALYDSRDLGSIDFGPYMRRLVHELAAFYGADLERVQILAEADDVVLSTEQALPLGLIVNELVSNALKHAFPDGRAGTIKINLRYLPQVSPEGQHIDNAWCSLCVHDDGVGIHNADVLSATKTTGLRLVNLLTSQLKGTLYLNRSHSTEFSIQFPR